MNADYRNDDCLKFLSGIENDSVDMVLTDPPYNIGFDGGKKWDRFENKTEYKEWCAEWTKECVRVLKPNRMMCVFGTLKNDDFIEYKLNTTSTNPELTPQEEIIWSYNWGGRKKTNFARKHEYVWCWSKGDEFLFNARDVMVERKTKQYAGRNYKDELTIPTCVWEKNNHTTSKEYCKWHPTQKPLMILQRLIRAYTNAGDHVIDIFSGSGSTAIACNNEGRKFSGCELNKDYFEKSLIRIKELSNA